MALENAYTVNINVAQSIKSLKDLKKEVEADAIALAGLTEGTDEYEKAAADLTAKQEQLNKAVGLAKNANTAAEGSYAALSKQMAELRKEWRAAGDEAERKRIGAEINQLNNQLKQMDASIGVYSRNVGNYGNALGQAFTQAGGVIGGQFTSAVNTANTAMKLFATNPVGAMLTLLVPLIMKVVNGLKTSEDNANAAAQAFSGFKVVGDLVTKALQGLGTAIGWVGQQFTKLLDKLNIGTEKRKERLAITEEEIALQKKEREYMVQNAKMEEEVSELRAKAADKQKYTAAERRKFLDEAIAKEKQINANELEVAQAKYDLLQRQSKLTQNSKEVNDQLAEAEANLYRVRQQYNEKNRSLTRELNRTINEEGKAAAATTVKTEAEMFAERLQQLDKFNDKWEQKNKERHEKEAKTQAEAWEKMKIVVPEGLQPVIDAANDAYGEDVFNKRMAEEQKQRLEEATFNVAKASIDGLADLMEASGENNKRAVEAAKGLRAASATMDAFAAANSAYNAMASIPVVGPALGIAAAAAAIASGIANVRKILATNTSTSTAASATSAGTATAASVQAPAIVQEVAATRTITTSSQTQTLNKIASDTRVYVVESDIAQTGKKVEVRENEAKFG